MAAALVLAACGGGSDDDSSSDGGGDTPAASGGDLLIWIGTGPRRRGHEDVAAAFGEENGVNVKVEVVPGDKLQANFVTASQAGKAPDVVFGAHDWIGNLVQNGTIDPIQLPAAATRTTLQPLAVKAVTFNGQVYGMPFTMNNIVLYRNTELAPEAPATIEDMVTAGRGAARSRQGRGGRWPGRSGRHGQPVLHQPALHLGRRLHVRHGRRRRASTPSDLGVATPGAVTAYEKIGALGEKGENVLKRSISTDNALVAVHRRARRRSWSRAPGSSPPLDESDFKYDVSAVPGFEGGGPGLTVHHRRRRVRGQQGRATRRWPRSS